MKEKDPLDQLVSIILAKPKYQHIHPDFIRYIGKQELTKRTNLKEVVEATLRKLHQVGAAYFDCKPDYSTWQAQMKGLSKDIEDPNLKAFCKMVMKCHASSRERLPILKTFFHETLTKLAPITSVLDLACGFNPLAIPWMPLDKNATYFAYDIYSDLIVFINSFFEHTAVKGKAVTVNIMTDPPQVTAHVTLLLKSLPCLEQLEKGISRRLLNKINSRHLLVSYPIHSLSGKSKGMRNNYTRQLHELIKNKPWEVERFDFPSELAFLIHK